MSFSFIFKQLLKYAEPHLPPAVYRTLLTVLENVYAVYLFVIQFLPETLQPQSILPLAFSIFMFFMAVRSVYRSTMFAIRTAWWIFKWSVMLGVIASLLGGNQVRDGLQQFIGQITGRNMNAIDVGNWFDAWLTSPTTQPRRKSRRPKESQSKQSKQRKSSPPTVFDSFEAHRIYAEQMGSQENHGHSSSVDEESGNIEQIYEQVQNAWAENGRHWWETFGRMAGFVGDEETATARGPKRKQTKQRTSTHSR